MKTYIVNYTNAKTIRVKVADDTTVTFGGLIPGAKVDGGFNRTALRFYEKKNQIAVLTGVESFSLVESVEIMEKVTQSASKDVAYADNGVTKVRSVRVTTEEWKNPNDAQPNLEANKLFNQLQIEA